MFVAILLTSLLGYASCGDVNIDNRPDDLNNGLAPKQNIYDPAQAGSDAKIGKYFYNFTTTDGGIVYMNITKGPMFIDIIGKDKQDQGEKPKVKQLARSFLDVKPTISANKSNTTDGQEVYELKMSFQGLPKSNGSVSVKSADLTMTIQVGGPSRKDYWNLTSASVDISYTDSGKDGKLSADLTPRFGYTTRGSDTSCQLGYGVCAPLNLCWSCTDQVLGSINMTAISKDSLAAQVHFPGLRLQPKIGKSYRYGYNWDCEALIPLSVWVGILLSLFLASIVMWSLSMLNTIHGPSKFDDPKGPVLHVPQAD